MVTKWNIKNIDNIKMLINMIQVSGGIEEDGSILLPIERKEQGFVKTSKDVLLKFESSGKSISDLHDKLLEQSEDFDWSDGSIDIQIPRSVPDHLDEEGPLTWFAFGFNLLYFLGLIGTYFWNVIMPA